MSDEHSFISPDHFHPDPYRNSRTAERTLNAAIVHAEISRSYEEYCEIFDEFYADDTEGSSETIEEPIRGKERVRSLLFSFLFPFMQWPEVGGVSLSIRERRFLEMLSTRPILRGHLSWSGVRQNLHCALAHLAEMERIACSAGASLRPPTKR